MAQKRSPNEARKHRKRKKPTPVFDVGLDFDLDLDFDLSDFDLVGDAPKPRGKRQRRHEQAAQQQLLRHEPRQPCPR